MSLSLTTLRDYAKQRADMVNSNFVSDPEWTVYLNGGYAELYELVVSRFEDYFTTSFQFTIAAGLDGYTMPSSVYKIRGLDKAISTPTDWARIRRFQFTDRNRYHNRINSYARGYYSQLQYNWIGNSIKIIPAEEAPGTYQLWYVPGITLLSAESDVIDPTLEQNDWCQYMIVDAAIKALQKEESDVSVLVMQKEQLKQRIEAMASNRDAGESLRVSDTSIGDGWDSEYGW